MPRILRVPSILALSRTFGADLRTYEIIEGRLFHDLLGKILGRSPEYQDWPGPIGVETNVFYVYYQPA